MVACVAGAHKCKMVREWGEGRGEVGGKRRGGTEERGELTNSVNFTAERWKRITKKKEPFVFRSAHQCPRKTKTRNSWLLLTITILWCGWIGPWNWGENVIEFCFAVFILPDFTQHNTLWVNFHLDLGIYSSKSRVHISNSVKQTTNTVSNLNFPSLSRVRALFLP